MITGLDHAERYWEAVSAGDETAAQAAADAAVSDGLSLTDVLTDLVLAAQTRVGRCWASNEWTVAREHAATAVSEAVVLRLGARLGGATDDLPILVTCAEREWHALPALALTQALRSWGHDAEHLGANVSPELVVGRILDRGPRAVLVSASLSSSLMHVRRLVEAVRGTGTPVVVGGRAFDTGGIRARRLGATAYAADLTQARDVVATLPHHVAPAPPLRHPGAAEAQSLHAAAAEVTRSLLSGPGSGLDATAASPDDWRVVFATYVPHVVGCVVGGLLTEDASVLADARSWLTDVLVLRGGSADAVDTLWAGLADQLRDHPEALRLLAQA
ncbi:cobalamin B12-binding domain-containing protein [Nocardioides donggukensis]|uniref:Cobalamin B12-binding domain-containing protein n=1 Tax=Nocardioides donggukensis TaxID=2774019 RepID=A0A927PYU3_9ACTN|nr:cobalamin-dependent protein [Nocardioides donggukensis]MBD8868948.1 cobalamin B12-binding domain-containing protein [Nocardioides donggukensis]